MIAGPRALTAGDWIDPLPKEVRGVEVGTDHVAHLAAEAQQRPRVVDDEARMHLEAEQHAVLGGEGARFAPVRATTSSHCQVTISANSGGHAQVTQLLAGAWSITGTAGEHVYPPDAELRRQAHAVAIDSVVVRGPVGIRMSWVPMTAQRADLEPALRERLAEAIARPSVRQQLRWPAVSVAR